MPTPLLIGGGGGQGPRIFSGHTIFSSFLVDAMSLRCIPLVFGTFSCEIISWLGFNNFPNTHTLYRRTCSSFKLKSIKIISISMHFLFLNENSVLLNKLINTSVQQPRRGIKGGTRGDWGHLPPPACIIKRPWPSHFISQKCINMKYSLSTKCRRLAGTHGNKMTSLYIWSKHWICTDGLVFA